MLRRALLWALALGARVRCEEGQEDERDPARDPRKVLDALGLDRVREDGEERKKAIDFALAVTHEYPSDEPPPALSPWDVYVQNRGVYAPDGSLGRGFGDKFDWWGLEGGMAESNRTGKISMVVVHKSWCGRCQQLGPSFAQESTIKYLADQFVMINICDEEEPQEERFNPGGHGYIPRIMFFDSAGELMDQFWSRNKRWPYFCAQPLSPSRHRKPCCLTAAVGRFERSAGGADDDGRGEVAALEAGEAGQPRQAAGREPGQAGGAGE